MIYLQVYYPVRYIIFNNFISYYKKKINKKTTFQQSVSPYGSKENLRSPQSPTESYIDWQGSSRKSSISAEHSQHQRRLSTNESGESQSTTEMFKEMLTQKRNLLINKLTSFDSDVSINQQII